VGALFAQTKDQDSKFRRGPRHCRESFWEFRQDLETSTISGKLEFINGNIAIKADDTVFYIVGLGRLLGFVEGLKEGAEVSLEGWAFSAPRAPEYRSFLVSKLTLNGKEYADLLPGENLRYDDRSGRGGPAFGPMMGPPYRMERERHGPRRNRGRY
jgi:hypothetical protein